MPTRLRTRHIALSATFVALAAGGTAACDDAPDTVEETHRFYCTSQDGTVVDEDNCDDDSDGHGGMFLLWHSTSAPAGLSRGHKVPAGGQSFAYNDKAARTSWGLPATGRIGGNGVTTKVGVVGKGGAPVGSGGGAKAGG